MSHKATEGASADDLFPVTYSGYSHGCLVRVGMTHGQATVALATGECDRIKKHGGTA